MTLIETRNSGGVTGRCDAKCYNAEHPTCRCVCGGRNHGARLRRAVENTREATTQITEEWNKVHTRHKITIMPDPVCNKYLNFAAAEEERCR